MHNGRMTTTTKTAAATTFISYASETCRRCLGTGRYSYNPTDGDTCFACRGRRVTLTRDAAASKGKVDARIARITPRGPDGKRPKLAPEQRAALIAYALTLPGVTADE